MTKVFFLQLDKVMNTSNSEKKIMAKSPYMTLGIFSYTMQSNEHHKIYN